jgi:two-component system chemotaxis sensor kinase CheA
MMSDTNSDDLVQDYLAECGEHLATIETDLLLIEQGGEEIDEQLVNRVFRAAHSIKGGAGFFDLTKIRELAHQTENVLDLVRSRQMVPTPEVVSILLMAFDKLREMIGRYRESNESDIAEFVGALTRLTADNLPADRKRSVTERLAVAASATSAGIQVSAFDLSQARTGGKSVFLVRYDLIHDIQRLGKHPYQVLKSLMEYGTIIETVFDLDSAGTLDDEPVNQLLLEVLFSTALGPELIRQAVDVPPERICVVAKDGSVRTLAEAEAAVRAPVPAADPVAGTPVKRAKSTKSGRPAKSAKPAKLAQPAATVEQVQSVAPVEPARSAAPVEPAPSVEHAAPAAVEAHAPEASPKSAPGAPASTVESTIRLNVALLDSLMTLAGELVLSRNQLNDSVARQDERGIRSGAQRIHMVTSELQEAVTMTRMQPVGNVFAKFPRLVRDLARDLGKEVQLKIEGAEVELDKTIIEGLSDPLTHMVRNSVDHGIESPDTRAAAKKPRMGTVTLKAAHQAGQVVIEISDDGKGLDAEKVAASALSKGLITRETLQGMAEKEKMALILLPGVSTAQKISDVSGRGVGMDVVKTNLDKLGGKIEIDSKSGRGTTLRIKLPLTLAIIPSLLISHRGERFAIPQVNVGELIRVRAGQVAERIRRVGDAEVLIQRDRLVPLVRLSTVMGLDPEESAGAACNVVLVDTGAFEYGLVVDKLHDTVEIVVKPLGRHLKGLPDYAGATILGDGRVAVILDVAGLAARAGLSATVAQAVSRADTSDREIAADGETYALLLFENGPGEACAAPIYIVSRIERVRPAQIERLGGRRTMQYRGASLPVIALSDVATVGELTESQAWVVIVFEHAGRPMGLLAAEPLDMIETRFTVDRVTLRQQGIAGSTILKGKTTLIVDIQELAGDTAPQQAETALPAAGFEAQPAAAPTVLLAEDSDFFRGQIKRLIEAVGYSVLAAEDGQAAWELLDQHAGEVSVVATDIEMPRMNGLELTRRIRADARFRDLPVIAVSTLAGDEEIARGIAAGVTEYRVKLNKDELMESIRKAVEERPHDRHES